MKILVVGGHGTIGSSVVRLLREKHEVVTIGRKSGAIHCDIKSEESIRQMYQKAGSFDSVAVCAGNVHFEDLSQMNAEKYWIGLNDKLMGQIRLVLIGKEFIENAGSFTLTSGILSDDPIRSGTSASMVNGAINSFIKAAAIEMPRSLRINAVSPTVLTESMPVYAPFFPGFKPVEAHEVALAYLKSVEGAQTGQVYKVGY